MKKRCFLKEFGAIAVVAAFATLMQAQAARMAEASGTLADIAVMAVHFWSCDDRYGSPRVGDLQSKSVQTNDRNDAPSSTTNNQRRDDNFFPKSDR